MPSFARVATLVSLLAFTACGGTTAPAASPEGASAEANAPEESGTSSTPAAPQGGKGSKSGKSVASDAPPPAGTYRILLERATKVGAKYKRTTKVTDSRHELLVEGKKTLKDVDHRVQITLVADEEVLAVDARGRWQKIKLKTQVFSAAGAKGDEPIVPPGTTLTIERATTANGEPTMTSSAGELTKDARKALGLAIPSNAKTVSDDDVFGSAEPRAPGASWDVARDVAARDLDGRGIKTSPDLIEGNTRIIATREDRGVPCLEMAARMTVKITGLAGLPEGTAVERGAVTAELTGIVPVDTKKQSHKSASRVGMELVATLPIGNAKGTLTIQSLSVRETTYEER